MISLVNILEVAPPFTFAGSPVVITITSVIPFSLQFVCVQDMDTRFARVGKQSFSIQFVSVQVISARFASVQEQLIKFDCIIPQDTVFSKR